MDRPGACPGGAHRDSRSATWAEGEIWQGFYGVDAGGLDTPGTLAALIGPLAESAIPVFVASTYHADLVLVPAHRLEEASAVLRDAGHRIAE